MKQPAPVSQIQAAIAQKKVPPEVAKNLMMQIPSTAGLENIYWQGWQLRKD